MRSKFQSSYYQEEIPASFPPASFLTVSGCVHGRYTRGDGGADGYG